MSETTNPTKTPSKQPVERIIPIQIENQSPRRSTRNLEKSFASAASSSQQKPPEPSKQEEKDAEDDAVINESASEEISFIENDSELDFEIPERSVMPCNQLEKIIFVVDTALDDNCSLFQLNEGVTCTPLALLKRAIEMFLTSKSAFDQKHQYALVVLNENESNWILDFTADVNKFLKELYALKECHAEDIFNLNSLFNVINEYVSLEPVKDDSMIPPAYVVRTVLCYARSYTLPELTKTEEVENLLNSPYFTFDILMTHEPPNTDNNCAKIAKILQEIDVKGFAYFFSVARSAPGLFVAMAKLLSHPLQRPIQRLANYKLA